MAARVLTSGHPSETIVRVLTYGHSPWSLNRTVAMSVRILSVVSWSFGTERGRAYLVCGLECLVSRRAMVFRAGEDGVLTLSTRRT